MHMSKGPRISRTPQGNRRVTDFFQRSSSVAPAPSSPTRPKSSRPPSPKGMKTRRPARPPRPDDEVISISSGTSCAPSRPRTRGVAAKRQNRAPPRPDQEVISISSGSAISLSSVILISEPRSQEFANSPLSGLSSPSDAAVPEAESPSRGASKRLDPVSLAASPPNILAGRKRKRSLVKTEPDSNHIPLQVPYNPSSPLTEPPSSDALAPHLPVPDISDYQPALLPVNTLISMQAKPHCPDHISCHHSASNPVDSVVPVQVNPHVDSPSQSKACRRSPSPFVPSSQSDEQELPMRSLSQKSLGEVRSAVDLWREQSARASIGPSCADDDVHSPVPAAGDSIITSSGLSEMQVDAQLMNTGHTSTSEPATPPQKPVALPRTPKAINASSKTAEIIAQIKAKVTERSPSPSSSDRSAPLNIGDLSESDSDDDPMADLRARQNKPGVSTRSTSASTSVTPSLAETRHQYGTRATMRLAKPSPPTDFTSMHSSDEDAKSDALLEHPFSAKARLAPSLARNVVKPKRRANPLESLLREKHKADKTGAGFDGLQKARTASGNVNALEDFDMDVDRDDDTNLDETDKAAAFRAAQVGLRMAWSTDEPTAQASSSRVKLEDTGIDGRLIDGSSLLGEKRGQAVAKLLESDMRHYRSDRSSKKPAVGVDFWNAAPLVRTKPAAPRISKLNVSAASGQPHPVIALLSDAVERQDCPAVLTILHSPLLSSLGSSHVAHITTWLLEQALAPNKTAITYSAHLLLMQLVDRGMLSGTLPINFSIFARACAQVGAKSDFLRFWMDDTRTDLCEATSMEREDLQLRLLTLLISLARAAAIRPDQGAATVTLLVLMGMDSSTQEELKALIKKAVDSVLQSLGSAYSDQCCSALRDEVKGMTPRNKVELLACLCPGSPVPLSVGQWLAASILFDPCSEMTPMELPRVDRLIKLLSDPDNTGSVFHLHDDTDYAELETSIDILEIATSDVHAYLSQPDGAKALDALHTALLAYHGQIGDTRASHLERSQVKAKLYRLAMRIHYQTASAKSSGPRRKEDMRAFFKPKIETR